MAYFVAPISLGLGDLIVSLPVVQALIDSGQKTYLVSRANSQNCLASRIEGLCGVISEEQFDPRCLTRTDSYINMREHPLQKDFWWGSPPFDRYYSGYKINDLLQIICRDYGIQANFEKLKPLGHKLFKEAINAVIFVPGSDSTYKCWPKNNWLSLASFLKERSLKVYVLGEPESSQAVQELLPNIQWLPTLDLTHALDIISSAKAVIAVDTGLMHLAVHQGIPTISLYRSYPIYERVYPNSFTISARACDARCIQESLQYTNNNLTDLNGFVYRSWQCQADRNQSCMESISTDTVKALIQERQELFLNSADILSTKRQI